jgi:hypothetical protein
MVTTQFNAQFVTPDPLHTLREWGNALFMILLPGAVFLSVSYNLTFTALVLIMAFCLGFPFQELRRPG